MNKEQKMVKEFHEKFLLTINDSPVNPTLKEQTLRENLILEEVKEFCLKDNTLLERLDALCDLLYVVYGTGVTYGFDLEKAFEEVHRSNMTKLWTEEEIDKETEKDNYIITYIGGSCIHHYHFDKVYLVKRKSDGKVIKSPSYSPANLRQFLKPPTTKPQ